MLAVSITFFRYSGRASVRAPPPFVVAAAAGRRVQVPERRRLRPGVPVPELVDQTPEVRVRPTAQVHVRHVRETLRPQVQLETAHGRRAQVHGAETPEGRHN